MNEHKLVLCFHSNQSPITSACGQACMRLTRERERERGRERERDRTRATTEASGENLIFKSPPLEGSSSAPPPDKTTKVQSRGWNIDTLFQDNPLLPPFMTRSPHRPPPPRIGPQTRPVAPPPQRCATVQAGFLWRQVRTLVPGRPSRVGAQ